MSVELTIRIASPLNAGDRELLAGIAVMCVAVVNHAHEGQPPDEPSCDEETPTDWSTPARTKGRPSGQVQ